MIFLRGNEIFIPIHNDVFSTEQTKLISEHLIDHVSVRADPNYFKPEIGMHLSVFFPASRICISSHNFYTPCFLFQTCHELTSSLAWKRGARFSDIWFEASNRFGSPFVIPRNTGYQKGGNRDFFRSKRRAGWVPFSRSVTNIEGASPEIARLMCYFLYSRL